MLNVHEMQDPIRGGTKALSGDNDWTQVQLSFNSGQMTEVTINCLFGGWGRVTGTAWFDDIELTLAPGSELAGEVGRVVRLVTNHYAQRGPVESILPTLVALNGASPALAVPVLDGLVSGWPQDKSPPGDMTENAHRPDAVDAQVRDRFSRWRSVGARSTLGANIAATHALKKQNRTPRRRRPTRGRREIVPSLTPSRRRVGAR
jgi:hypothetical protein